VTSTSDLDRFPQQSNLFGLEQSELTSNDYYTPRWIFDELGLEFDMDVCGPPGGGIAWIPAKVKLSMKEDGLATPWTGRVWMNPPYSDPSPWIRKFLEHRHGVALLPMVKSKAFNALWRSEAALALTPHDMKFTTPKGPVGISFQTVLAAFGDECVRALANISPVRGLRLAENVQIT